MRPRPPLAERETARHGHRGQRRGVCSRFAASCDASSGRAFDLLPRELERARVLGHVLEKAPTEGFVADTRSTSEQALAGDGKRARGVGGAARGGERLSVDQACQRLTLFHRAAGGLEQRERLLGGGEAL